MGYKADNGETYYWLNLSEVIDRILRTIRAKNARAVKVEEMYLLETG